MFHEENHPFASCFPIKIGGVITHLSRDTESIHQSNTLKSPVKIPTVQTINGKTKTLFKKKKKTYVKLYLEVKKILIFKKSWSMFHHVPPCSTMFHHVPPCSTMFHHVPPCSTMFHHVPPCSTMFHRHISACNLQLHRIRIKFRAKF